MDDEMDSTVDRVRARLDALGINPFEADRRAGFKRGFVYDLMNGSKKDVRGKYLVQLSNALECDAEYLLMVQDEPRRFRAGQPGSGSAVRFAGVIESGAWRDADLVPRDGHSHVSFAPDPWFDVSAQAVYQVEDTALDTRGIDRGMFVLAVDPDAWVERFGRVQDGTLVVVRRTREDDGVLQCETSARIVKPSGLEPDSTNPRYRTIAPETATVIGVIRVASRVLAPA